MLMYLTLAVCALAVGVLIWRYDLYEKEPIRLLLLTAGMGYGAMAGMGPAEAAVLDSIAGEPSNFAIAMVVANMEEAARLGVVLTIWWWFPNDFNDPLDGIIYGSVAGLGMAVEESVFVLGRTDSQDWMLPGAELVRLLGHPIMGGIGASCLGLLAIRHPRWRQALPVGFLGAVALHFVWDWIALQLAEPGGDRAWMAPALVGLMVAGMIAYGALVLACGRLSRAHFGVQRRRLWGWPFRQKPD